MVIYIVRTRSIVPMTLVLSHVCHCDKKQDLHRTRWTFDQSVLQQQEYHHNRFSHPGQHSKASDPSVAVISKSESGFPHDELT